MGLLDGLTSQLGAALGTGNDPTKLLEAASGLIQGHDGGLQGLLSQLQAGGLGTQVASWVGNGSNLPVTGEQLQAALSSPVLAGFAAKLGIDPATAATHLATVLPHLVDHATPDGQPASQELLNDGLALLKGKLFG